MSSNQRKYLAMQVTLSKCVLILIVTNTPVSFTVQACDERGKVITRGGDALEVALFLDGALQFNCPVTDRKNGQYQTNNKGL